MTAFQAVPAVDLRGGACVQLVQGDPSREAVNLPDPVQAARDWVDRGARWLHVVDLDKALGSGDNRAVIARILDAVPDDVSVQVGGGVRSLADVDALLAMGADRVVVGTRAVTDDAFLGEAAAKYGDRLVVAVDARGDDIVVKGWTEASGKSLTAFAKEAADRGVRGFLYTDVGREGLLGGANVDGVRTLVDAVPGAAVIASGGVTTVDDLVRLRDAGAWGAVVGMAFYTGRIDYGEALAALSGKDE